MINKRKKFFIVILIIIIILVAALLFVFIKRTKTYSDERFGFSFRHPADWEKATDTPVGVVFTPSDKMSVVMISKLDTIDELLTPFKDNKNYSLISSSFIEVNGIKAEETIFTFKENDELIKFRLITTDKYKDHFYCLSFIAPEEQFNRDLSGFEKILKSFKF